MDLFDPLMLPKQILPSQSRVDLGVMAMKRYSTLSKSLKLELNNQMQFSVIPRTPFLVVALPHCRRYSQ